MKYTLLFIIMPCLLLLFPGNQQETAPTNQGRLPQQNIISCAPSLNEETITAVNNKFMVPLPGWGSYSYTISTTTDSAQFYFNQGLNMYYSYHRREAIASFREAARLDSTCAMTYWAQALAMGPAYNFAYSYVMQKEVPGVMQKMNETMTQASPKEKALIAAMNSRYSSDAADQQRKALNEAYAGKMRQLIDQYPEDADIKLLYIDAVMLIHAWNFWNNDGTAQPWTPELVQLSESVLKTHPRHPGVLHYYIHLTEASRNPGVALASADILKEVMPGVAHMVHMSSHEYERNGLYALGVEVNDKADDDLLLYDSLVKSVTLAKHVPHYFAVQSYCALSGGIYKKGMPKAYRCRGSVKPASQLTFEQSLYMFPEMALVRMGKWQEILQDSAQPNPSWEYASLLNDFAQGMALVYTGKPEAAEAHLKQLRSKSTDSSLYKPDTPFSKLYLCANVADYLLNGAILYAHGQQKAALASFRKAIETEDQIIYSEPKDWMIPARQYLGAYLMKMRKYKDAEKVYQEDLVWNPGTGWSLLGLYQALTAQGKTKEAAPYKEGYLKAFSAADEIPPASAYIN
jgi:hypothetical protein